MNARMDRLREEIEETTRDMGDSDWSSAPRERWSSAEILEHMGRSYGTTAKMLELRLEAGGPPEVRTAKVTEFLKKFLVVDLGIFPSGTKSPEMVRPQGDPGLVARERALKNLLRMDAAIAVAEMRWGNAPIAMHPVLGPLTAGEWRKFHFVHGQHHLAQIRKRVPKKAAR